MSADGTRPLPPLSQRHFTLATDLDGTFLGGTDADRARLYGWIEGNRDSVGLIFVTGRDPHFITAMVRDGEMPRPDYVVGDVGTTIAAVDETAQIHPIAELEAQIADLWADRGAAVRSALAGHPGLALQPTAFRYRISFDLDPSALEPRSAETVQAMGLDMLISDNRYFDVLPPGISKGPSLLRLIDHLGVPKTRVLGAGDTMNDHSMLVCGLKSVAVGGSEPALLDRVADLPLVYKAHAAGAGGILEAIAALGLHPGVEEPNHV